MVRIYCLSELVQTTKESCNNILKIIAEAVEEMS